MGRDLIPLGAALASLAVWAAAGVLLMPRPAAGEEPVGRFARLAAAGAALVATTTILAHELLGIRVGWGLPTLLAMLGVVRLLVARRSAHRPPARFGAESTALLLLAAGTFLATARGAMQAPGFEGRDPWGHALGISYLLDTGSLHQPFDDWPVIQYVDAYPPAYDLLLSFPARFAGSVAAPAKATNGAIVALALLLFHRLARALFRDPLRAALATGFWAALPGNLSRHVWSHSLAVLFLLGLLEAALRLRARRTEILPAAFLLAGALLAAPTTGFEAALLLLVTSLVGISLSRRFALRLVTVGLLAAIAVLPWTVGVLHRWGDAPGGLPNAFKPPEIRRLFDSRPELAKRPDIAALPPAWHGSRPLPPTWTDFFSFRRTTTDGGGSRLAPPDPIVPRGVGAVLLLLDILFIAGMWLRGRRRSRSRRFALAWWLFSLLGVCGPLVGLVFFPWRFWMLVVAFAALLAGGAAGDLARAGTKGAAFFRSIVILLAVGHAVTAAASDTRFDNLPNYFRSNPAFAAIPIGALLLLASARSLRSLPAPRFPLLLLVALVVALAPVRLRVLTAAAPPRLFFDSVEHEGYLRLARERPPGTRAWPLSGGARHEILAGLDLGVSPWRAGENRLERRLRDVGGSMSNEELLETLRGLGYEWLVVDPTGRDEEQAIPGRPRRTVAGLVSAGARVAFSLPVGDAEPTFALLHIGPPFANRRR